MNIKEVKDLIHDVLQSDISEFELEHTGTRLRLRRGYYTEAPTAYAPPPPALTVTPSVPPRIHEPPPAPESPGAAGDETEQGLHYITSPIVGTFYRASKPDAEPFVRQGQTVEEGSVLCIVEAMKLMNEIPSDMAGEVVQILVENGRPVEFGQRLFAVRPRR